MDARYGDIIKVRAVSIEKSEITVSVGEAFKSKSLEKTIKLTAAD